MGPSQLQAKQARNRKLPNPRTIWNWCRSLKRGCFAESKPSYIRVGRGEIEAGRWEVPKGHLAVYVGEREDDPRRCLVPVIYFNHPLFENLLREAEAEYGFNHLGGIQIPCGLSEFKNVQTRIAAADGRAGGCGPNGIGNLKTCFSCSWGLREFEV
ncbi:auxin-responsive protein SAUR36-like [Diospyros lotus]|uniref:auxin-responsive protein SAUR36-like n=1 Tax=Diospyros lotus TaxID=55363 RepID=UPI00224FD229|nr:auxin-responsive protein SAUR36-like [Diospyros lotus]